MYIEACYLLISECNIISKADGTWTDIYYGLLTIDARHRNNIRVTD